jgi:hypothetical protein
MGFDPNEVPGHGSWMGFITEACRPLFFVIACSGARLALLRRGGATAYHVRR